MKSKHPNPPLTITVLSADELNYHTNPKNLPKACLFQSDFGQQRAMRAIKTALGINAHQAIATGNAQTNHQKTANDNQADVVEFYPNTHIFAVGEAGLGKRRVIGEFLRDYAKSVQTPDDWVYVYNFDEPKHPLPIRLPAGLAPQFCRDIKQLWQRCQQALQHVFTGQAYQKQLKAIKAQQQAHKKQLLNRFNASASAYNLVVADTLSIDGVCWSLDELIEAGVFDDGWSDNFDKYDNQWLVALDPNKAITASDKAHIKPKFNALTQALFDCQNTAQIQTDILNQTLAQKALAPIFAQYSNRYDLNGYDGQCQKYLKQVQDDMTSKAMIIAVNDTNHQLPMMGDVPVRYWVQVLVSHQDSQGLPVVSEYLPNDVNLFGAIKPIKDGHNALASISDLVSISAGALHRANGGFLLINAQELLNEPALWQKLSCVLQTGQLSITTSQTYHPKTWVQALPEPYSVPLSLTVILLGSFDIFEQLATVQPQFKQLFGIRADFCHRIAKTTEAEQALTAKINYFAKRYGLLPFNQGACAKVLDELCRMSGDQGHLDWHEGRLLALMREANYFGRMDTGQGKALINNTKPNNKPPNNTKTAQQTINALHVKQAIDERRYRESYTKELYWQEIDSGQQLLTITGQAVGQINALTVVDGGDNAFGLPVRLTALVVPKFGDGEILDIERDVELGGSIHAKAVLIMTSFLRALFSERFELNFSASLVFEQNYDLIDGDSATLAGLCALLSALANVPLVQHLAITGSMNQYGQVQAVGGINEKITAFFELCQKRGLDGKQGVILPRANQSELMLDEAIITAVKQGQFHLYAINHINDALHLLTGISVNDKRKSGKFKNKTLFGKIAKRLASWQDRSDK